MGSIIKSLAVLQYYSQDCWISFFFFLITELVHSSKIILVYFIKNLKNIFCKIKLSIFFFFIHNSQIYVSDRSVMDDMCNWRVLLRYLLCLL